MRIRVTQNVSTHRNDTRGKMNEETLKEKAKEYRYSTDDGEIPDAEQSYKWALSGDDGSIDLDTMDKRFSATSKLKKAVRYHLVTPCRDCTSCTIFRGFERGKLVTKGYYCHSLGVNVDKNGTCKQSRVYGPGRRKRVVVDMDGAPNGVATSPEVAAELKDERKKALIKLGRDLLKESIDGGYIGNAKGYAQRKHDLAVHEAMLSEM